MLNLDKKKRYLLACSYGPDSMALFYMLLKEGYSFSVAHVNYHLRNESDGEEEGLKSFCEKYKIQLFVHSVNELNGQSGLEEKCRNIRYSFFSELISKNNFDALLTAHHLDDHLETYLMQKKRKNLVKYFGINEFSHIFGIEVIRPLLGFQKSELLDFCLKNNVPFSIDKSNLSDCFTRNKIRHEIIDKMSKDDKETLSAKIDKENTQLNSLFKKLNQSDLNNVSVVNKLTDNELCYALNLLYNSCSKMHGLSHSRCMELKKIIFSKKANVICHINSKVDFIKEYDRISFILSNNDVHYSFVISEPSELETDYFYLNFKEDASNRNISISDYPLTIRNISGQDDIYINDYKVKARRLLIDWKMPVSLRKRWPVIVNKDNKVIYIPRYQKNFVATKNLNFYVK